MRIEMRAEQGDGVLAGSVEGRAFLARMMQLVGRGPAEPEPLLLDFSGIAVATSSYLREAVVQTRDMLRGRRSNFYPIVGNANEGVLEELTMLLQDNGDALLACTTDRKGRLNNIQPIGRLEGVQQRTFDLVQERGEIGAVEAQKSFPDETATVTAWNNRFASLAERGLVVEVSRGRLKLYRAVSQEK